MGERIINPGERYYAGGTVPRIAGHDGKVEPFRMSAAEYASIETKHTSTQPDQYITIGLDGRVPVSTAPHKKVFRGGTAG